MSMPGLSPQLLAPRPETAEAAALKLARASLEALALKVGQVLDAKVLGTGPKGLTQLSIAGQLLNVKLPVPLPAGTQLLLQVQAGGPQGLPVLVAQTPPQPAAKPPPLPGAAPSLPLPQMSVPAPAIGAPPVTVPLPQPPGSVAPPVPQAPMGVLPPGPPVLTATPLPAPPPLQAGTPQPAAPTAPPAPAPTVVPAVPGPSPVTTTAPPPMTTPAPQPPGAQAVAPNPAPANAATVAAPLPPAAAAAPLPAVPALAGAPPTSGILSTPATPPPAPVVPLAQGAPVVPLSPAPQNAAAPTVPATAPLSANPAPAAPPLPATASPSAPLPATTQLPTAAIPMRVLPQSPSPAPPPAGSVAEANLSQATQAAARQDSMAPLLQNLSALQGRIGEFPRPVVEAALRLLAGRISLDRAAPTGKGLKQAVLRSGIFLDALGKPAMAQSPTPGDAKAALLALRGAITAWLGEEVVPVAPLARRPQPPTRGAQPRGLRSEASTLPEAAAPKEAGRALLGQAEAALSRVRLQQLASLPHDAARAASLGPAAAAEWNLEIPLLFGHELAMAQLQISRDGKGERRERGWRMAFSLNFSALGEVGAQVSLFGQSASVLIWAEEDETAAALAQMLPELTPALLAKGLTIGSVRVRRGRPREAQPQSGQLLDSVR